MALVNNAAVQRLAKTSAVTMADWDESITVNLTAPMRLSQALLPELAANDGIILNIGSVHARATKKEFVSYATSKAALHGLKSEEHTSELQSLMRISYAVFCLKKTKKLKTYQ